MQDSYFLPETSVIVYAAVSVLLFVVVRMGRWMRVNWGAQGMRDPIGGGRIRQIGIDDDPATAAGTMAGNVMNSTTPGGGMALMLAALWLVVLFAGITVIPAAFGAMTRPTTLNIVLIVAAAIALAFAVTRMALTLVAWGIALALIGAVLAVIAVVVLFAIQFLSGGQSGIVRAAQSMVADGAGRMSRLTPLGPDLGKRAEFNGCLVVQSVLLIGAMEPARSTCDPAWEARRIQAADAAHRAQKRDGTNGLAEWNAFVDRHADGLSSTRIDSFTDHLRGSWFGVLRCGARSFAVDLRIEGDAARGRGTMVVGALSSSGPLPGVASTASAYRIELTKSERTVQLKSIKTVVHGSGTPAIEGTWDFRSGLIVNMVPTAVTGQCAGMLQARIRPDGPRYPPKL